ncbi:MAG TPA: CGNR zinc finger domain-containing protein [Planosporangium sp.]|nr:CGNR zinc finger domain-containing protein [Planosporangium sp.]
MADRKQELPPSLRPVLAFLNTVDVELATDDLAGGPSTVSAWLAAGGLISDGVVVTPAEYRTALALRSGLRALALLNNGGPADEAALEEGRRALRRVPLIAALTDNGDTALVPGATRPVLAALGRIAAGYVLATASGQWQRLRRCPAGDCAWVFWDSSPKGGRRWCTMRVCGNRAKARTFAERQRQRVETI